MAKIRQSMGVNLTDLRHHTILMVLDPHDFVDEEYYVVKDYLEKKHAHVLTTSTVPVAISQLKKEQKIDLLVKDVKVDHICAVVFIGGADELVDTPDVLRIAREFHKQGLIVGAIGSAPLILANSGILEETKATCDSDHEDFIREKGAHYTGTLLEEDNKIITAIGPEVSHGFAEKITFEILDHE
jgi:putative intracellular protease/amidase